MPTRGLVKSLSVAKMMRANFEEMSSSQAVVPPLDLIALNSDRWILSFPWTWYLEEKHGRF